MIPLDFFDPVTELEVKPLHGTFTLTGGFSFGMLVRTGLSKSITLETGISQITRRYDYHLVNDTNGFDDGGSLRYVGYEIPVLALIYIRLGQRTWMDNALGFSADMYPSDVVNNTADAKAQLFRNGWVQAGVVANIGVEYRTERSGILYLGATYHRPFSYMATGTLTWYTVTSYPYSIQAQMAGSYLTADLRYYFHEDPEKKGAARKKKTP